MTPTGANTHISSDWGKLLEPGLRTVFFNAYTEMPEQYATIFKMKTSQKAAEHELGMGAFKAWTERVNEVDNVTYQKIQQGLERVYTHKEFASGFAIGKRLYEDEQYGIINDMASDLGFAGRTKVETDAATVLNNAFSSAVGGAGVSAIYDGEALISAAHPLVEGGTASNLVTGALSDTKLKEAITLMRNAVDEAGKKIILMPDKLIVPSQLEWLALELTKSTHKVGTADNDINSLAGRLKVQVYDYLTDADAWFLMDSKRHKLSFFWRVKPEFAKATDSDNFVSKYNGRMRYSYGVSDWRGIVGSAGV